MGSTVSWGSGMAFLIGGPVTALPAMAVFLSLFKPRVLWLYLGICLSGRSSSPSPPNFSWLTSRRLKLDGGPPGATLHLFRRGRGQASHARRDT